MKKGGLVIGFLFLILLLSFSIFVSAIQISGQITGMPISNETQSNVTNYTCTDTDGGMNYYNKGTMTTVKDGVSSSVTDYCNYYSNPNILGEYYCGDNVATTLPYTCPYGCQDGACISSSNQTVGTVGLTTCTLPEVLEQKTCTYLGVNYTVKRSADSRFIFSYNGNIQEFTLEQLMQITLGNGVIVQRTIGSSGENILRFLSPTSTNQTTTPPTEAEITEPTTTETGEVVCISGCLFAKSCLPYGYRTSMSYCNIDNTLVKQIDEGSCNNNFECTSNLCIDGQCTSPGLFLRILNWFKALFGVDEDECVKKENSCCLGKKCDNSQIQCDSGENLVFKGCDNNCKNKWECTQQKNNIINMIASNNPDDYLGHVITSIEVDSDWENYAPLQNKVNELIAGKTNDYDKAFAIAKWVMNSKNYDLDNTPANDHGASIIEIFDSSGGICLDASWLTTAMLRKVGIVAKSVYGSGGPGHAFVHAYINGEWYVVDSTFGSKGGNDNPIFLKMRDAINDNPSYTYVTMDSPNRKEDTKVLSVEIEDYSGFIVVPETPEPNEGITFSEEWLRQTKLNYPPDACFPEPCPEYIYESLWHFGISAWRLMPAQGYYRGALPPSNYSWNYYVLDSNIGITENRLIANYNFTIETGKETKLSYTNLKCVDNSAQNYCNLLFNKLKEREGI